MNPGHKQKKSQEPDAPQWYIDAYINALEHGIGVVVIRNGLEPKHIPPAEYLETAEALKWAHAKITGLDTQ